MGVCFSCYGQVFFGGGLFQWVLGKDAANFPKRAAVGCSIAKYVAWIVALMKRNV